MTDPVISSAIVNSPSPPVLDEVVGFSPIVENSGYPGEKRLLLPSSNDFSSASVVPDSPLMTPPVTPMNQPAFISSGGGRKYQLRAPKNDRSPAVQVSISPSDRSKVSITTTASNQPGKSGRPLITIVSPGKTAPMTKRQQSH